jgi:hypothetical protein
MLWLGAKEPRMDANQRQLEGADFQAAPQRANDSAASFFSPFASIRG